MPRPLFDAPLSVVVEDEEGHLLSARIAADGQWRFPPTSLPEKYVTCVVAFEDKRFWYHPGVDPISLGRALWTNLREGRTISGGSTLTMQVIRLARGNPPRTLWEKLVEIFMATRLELAYSKREILSLYAAYAPFGGNVIGLEAACWRYFGKEPEALSWAEAAMLAVLPNSPALIHLGRNRQRLLEKRNRLLERLRQQGKISDEACALAKEEPLPQAPMPLPNLAPHLLDRLVKRLPARTGGRFRTAIRHHWQRQITEIAARWQALYRGNGIHNLAIVVVEVPSGLVRAYVGNAPNAGVEHGEQVDIVSAPRSTGSILKPFLYAMALEEGLILPHSLLEDVPMQMGRYRPENFRADYDGVVPAHRALARSLNVPFVRLLQDYGVEKFHFDLQRLGLTTFNKSPSHYGLSLILGGGEANLLEVTSAYAGMARRLGAWYDRSGQYDAYDFRAAELLAQVPQPRPRLQKQPNGPGAAALWFALEAMQRVERPSGAGEWEVFQGSRRVAWKTGTSIGFRDAWAIGVTPQYAVGVWVGNADGEGRPGLIGVEVAAPVLFDVFDLLPYDNQWFEPPYDDMTRAAVCRQSGYRAGPYCEADTNWIPLKGLMAPTCPYHQLLHLSADGQWQVNNLCASMTEMRHQPWFVLPPLQEHYYTRRNPSYCPPPPLRPDCPLQPNTEAHRPMQFIYPRDLRRIYVPIDLDGQPSRVVFQLAHRRPTTQVFWHLDGEYLGATRHFHQMALLPPEGRHVLTVVDENGYRIEQPFEVLSRQKRPN
ncbi:MAG: penicillin-binding protein 1C [Saprospiraceae bacterium]|nr:penicillin-binding protein 1C [Saprospiraceae bacterium]MDW8484095.1 penicillin-binding protein 1C [Saprospiraceae bacterium]